jgi:hypothetical protein
MVPIIKFYVVYHKAIHEDVYDSGSLENIQFFGVNENIEKTPITISSNIIQEHDLPIYESRFQERGYSETSAAWHIYKNNLHKDLDYIGFGQYDQQIKSDIFETFNRHHGVDKIFYFDKREIDHDNKQVPYDFLIEHYNKHFDTNITFDQLKASPRTNDSLILQATFIVSVCRFNRLMSWVVKLVEDIYPWANLPPWPVHHPHLGGVMERAYGLYFAIDCLLDESVNLVKLPIRSPHHWKIQKERGKSDALKRVMEEYGLKDDEIWKIKNILDDRS